MRFVNAAFFLASFVLVGGGYLQEKKRLAKFRELSAARAQALFEAAERRRERTMLVVTVVLVIAAAVAVLVRARR